MIHLDRTLRTPARRRLLSVAAGLAVALAALAPRRPGPKPRRMSST